MPRPGQVLGLVGTNGIGKSTALKILSGKLKPNLGRYDNPPDWEEILKYFRGSELQSKISGSSPVILTDRGRLLYQGPRRQPQGSRQAPVCRPDPQGHQGHRPNSWLSHQSTSADGELRRDDRRAGAATHLRP